MLRARIANSNKELCALLIGIFIFLAFRDSTTGDDTSNYIRIFHQIESYDFSHSGIELGYILYVIIIKAIFKHYQFLFIFQALLVSYSIGYFIKKYAMKDVFLSILLFVSIGLLAFHTTGLRQSMAMSLGLLSFCYFESGNKKKSILFIILAFLFHRSAIVMCGPFIYAFLIKNVRIAHTAIFSILCMLFVPLILPIFASFDNRWNMYAHVESTGNGFIMFSILLLILFLSEMTKKKENYHQRMWRKMMHYNVILWCGRLVSRTFERPVLYSFPFMMPLLINAITSLPDIHTRKVCRILSILLFSVFYVYRYHQTPYSLCFFN